MEVQESSLPAFYCSRIFGLAPFRIKRNAKKHIEEIQFSPWLCFYTICFLATLVALTVRFIFVDAHSKSPIRMRSSTSKFVTIFDVSVVVGACLSGALSGLFGYKIVQSVNMRLCEADKELSIYSNKKRDRRQNILMIVVVFATMTGMIVMDYLSKSRNASANRRKLEADGKLTDPIRMGTYVPFYLMYYILMALHVQFAQTAIGITRRYQRLNTALRNIFSMKKPNETISNLSTKNKVIVQPMKSPNDSQLPGTHVAVASPKSTDKLATISHAPSDENHVLPLPVDARESVVSVPSSAYGKLTFAAHASTRNTYHLSRLSYTHAILGETVELISSSYGLTLLIMLASCLMHLVATSYFLFFELLSSEPDTFAAVLQLLWCCFHLSRLLLIVEPCHLAATQAKKTIILISGILRNCKDGAIESILQRFWKQLFADRTHNFTACGMCTIDRQILTSISGAIATYLVILIQFQKTDG